MYDLLELQNANGLVISYSHASTSSDGAIHEWLTCGSEVFREQQRERAQASLMRQLFPHGVPMGVMGDGSNDRSQTEQEALATRFLGGDGKPFNGFYDLATLDLSTSSDGRSPDAQCITACYATSLDQLNKFEGFLFMSD